MTALINHTHRGYRRWGFTSVESVVVIFILSALAGFLLPIIRAARLAANRTSFVLAADQYCYDAPEREEREYPDNLHEWGTELGYFSSGEWTEQQDGSVVVEGDRFRLEYVTDYLEALRLLNRLRLLDEGAGEFIDAILQTGNPSPFLVATTIRPLGPTFGTSIVFMHMPSCARYVVFDIDAPTYQPDPVETAALQSVAIMLQSDANPRERAREIPTILRDPAAVEFVHGVFDRNSDGAITLGEFSQKSRQLAEAPTDDDSTLGQQVTKQFFRVVVNELSLTEADDESEEIIFSIDDAHDDPTELFSYQNLCDHTHLYVVDSQAEDKLCRRLRLAEFLEESDLLLPRDKVLTAQQRLLQRLSGDSLLPEAANELDILTEVRKGFGR